MKLIKAIALSSVLFLAGCGASNKPIETQTLSSKTPAELIKLHNEKAEKLKSFSAEVSVKATVDSKEESNLAFKIDLFTNPMKGKGKISIKTNTLNLENVEVYINKDSLFTKVNEKWTSSSTADGAIDIQDLALNKDLKHFIGEHSQWFEVKESDKTYIISLKEKEKEQYEDFLKHFKTMGALGKNGSIKDLSLEIEKEGNPVRVNMEVVSEELKMNAKVESKFSNYDSVEDFELPKVE